MRAKTIEITRWETAEYHIELEGINKVVIRDDHGNLLAEYAGYEGRDFEIVQDRTGGKPVLFFTLDELLAHFGIESENRKRYKAIVSHLVGMAKISNHMAIDARKKGDSYYAIHQVGQMRAYMAAARSCREDLLNYRS